jgi:hypothetical protein
MRTVIAGSALAIVALLLGGCAGSGLGGGSALPSAGVSHLHPLDSVGGGPSLHSLDSVGGGPTKGNRVKPRGFHSLDSVGGGPSVHSLDSVGGGPTSGHR